MSIFFRLAIAAALALLPATAFAKISTINAGDYRIEYDQKFDSDTDVDGRNDLVSYYSGDNLVLAAFDHDKNGRTDLWLRYKNGDSVDLELADRDGNGDPDLITEVAVNEKTDVIYDAERAGGGSRGWFVVLALLAAAAYWRRADLRGNIPKIWKMTRRPFPKMR